MKFTMLFNESDGLAPEVHAAGCRDIARQVRPGRYSIDTEYPSFEGTRAEAIRFASTEVTGSLCNHLDNGGEEPTEEELVFWDSGVTAPACTKGGK